MGLIKERVTGGGKSREEFLQRGTKVSEIGPRNHMQNTTMGC